MHSAKKFIWGSFWSHLDFEISSEKTRFNLEPRDTFGSILDPG